MLTRGPQWALLLIAFCAATTLVAQQAAEIKGLLRQATDREVTDLEVAAGKSRTAQFALDKYDAFLGITAKNPSREKRTCAPVKPPRRCPVVRGSLARGSLE